MSATADSPVRTMMVMGAMMYVLKYIDQKDPMTVNYCRIAYALYIVVGMSIQAYITKQISAKADTREIEVPQPASLFGPPPGPPEKKTVMEYDLGLLNQARNSMLMNGLCLAFVHFKMGQVTPLVFTAAMGLMRFLDDPMFKIHVLNNEPVGPLERPFKAEKNPLLGLLTGQENANGENAEAAAEEAEEEDSDDAAEAEAEVEAEDAEEEPETSSEPKKTK
eukprot:Plantae.Rhodophyta-Purpureofilum_apyrenoidigerum.ctg10791.p1 GENE.Plantae.Rhodophyta-Purpureofilum_apyrenoidigerum.ctg10791~~Plantae.Rhodophyta-Purpureofilum_apyrenoidigerum.ctg10791.p1  ORF type:complete len:221 (-),score=47.59 Plantae.Rhodophyta-Purpureofilum_apyrenoidigerum.ctg10791:102-764(-)